jgi:lysophospholipase L1-like esterase
MPWLRNGLLLVASTLVALAAGELVARMIPAPWQYPLDPPEDALMIEDARLGYALRPGQVLQWTRENWSNRIAINADGQRDDPLPDARAAALRGLAVGDSFTFGIGVNHGEAWPEVLERALAAHTGAGAAVLNAGVPGYSARQIRLSALDLLDRVDPAFVVAAFYVRSYWRVNEPYAVFGGALVMSRHRPQLAITASGDLVFTPFRSGPLRDLDVWLKGHLQLPAHVLDRLGPKLWPERLVPQDYPDRMKWTEADYQPALDELAQLHDTLAARRIPLVLLLVNAQNEDGSFLADETRINALVTRFCAARDLPVADPLPRMIEEARGRPLYRTPSDLHWTALAHQIAAQQVEAVLAARGWIPQPEGG